MYFHLLKCCITIMQWFERCSIVCSDSDRSGCPDGIYDCNKCISESIFGFIIDKCCSYIWGKLISCYEDFLLSSSHDVNTKVCSWMFSYCGCWVCNKCCRKSFVGLTYLAIIICFFNNSVCSSSIKISVKKMKKLRFSWMLKLNMQLSNYCIYKITRNYDLFLFGWCHWNSC